MKSLKPSPLLLSGLLFFSSLAPAKLMWKDQKYFDSLKKKRNPVVEEVAVQEITPTSVPVAAVVPSTIPQILPPMIASPTVLISPPQNETLVSQNAEIPASEVTPRKIIEALKNLTLEEFKNYLKLDKPAKL